MGKVSRSDRRRNNQIVLISLWRPPSASGFFIFCAVHESVLFSHCDRPSGCITSQLMRLCWRYACRPPPLASTTTTGLAWSTVSVAPSAPRQMRQADVVRSLTAQPWDMLIGRSNEYGKVASDHAHKILQSVMASGKRLRRSRLRLRGLSALKLH